MLNLGNIERPERPKKMALNTEEIDKINDLYKQIDTLMTEKALLETQLSKRELFLDDRFDKIEKLIKELACACEKSSTN